MILCVEEAHKMRWIHRDVKPDNFLISASGHLKISDFGLAFDGHWCHNQTYHTEKRDTLLQTLGIEVRGDEEDIKMQNAKNVSRKIAKAVNEMQGRERSSTRNAIPRVESVLDRLNRTDRRKFAQSVVGTSQYMAPEVIRADDYDGRCDWWSIGIILYEVDLAKLLREFAQR